MNQPLLSAPSASPRDPLYFPLLRLRFLLAGQILKLVDLLIGPRRDPASPDPALFPSEPCNLNPEPSPSGRFISCVELMNIAKQSGDRLFIVKLEKCQITIEQLDTRLESIALNAPRETWQLPDRTTFINPAVVQRTTKQP